MKILVRKGIKSADESGGTPIMAAKHEGTTFYQTTLDAVISALENDKANVWLRAAIAESGFDALNFETGLWGSQVINDDLFICDTDGQKLNIDGTLINPETALEEYHLEALSPFIQQATDDIILRYITEYEIKTPDFDNLAIELLNGGWSFSELAKDAEMWMDEY